jgi:AraC-like DNA-binding protein
MSDRQPSGDGWRAYYGGLALLGRRRQGAWDLAVLPRLLRVRDAMAAEVGAAAALAGPASPAGPHGLGGLPGLDGLDNLDTMARAACFSKFHFLRLFRQAYGATPGRYRSQLRLERARTLLETTGRSVTDICLDVGFESLASFSGAFRKHTGESPQRYRRRWLALGQAAAAAPRVPRVPGCFVAMYG